MNSLLYHPEAEREFRESTRYYENEQSGLGDRFFAQIQTALNRIQHNPLTGFLSERGTRTYRVPGGFPYGIVFREREHQVQIIAVYHFSRRPGYWITRIEDES